MRRAAWEENLYKIHKHNVEAAEGFHSYTIRDNHLSDMVYRLRLDFPSVKC